MGLAGGSWRRFGLGLAAIATRFAADGFLAEYGLLERGHFLGRGNALGGRTRSCPMALRRRAGGFSLPLCREVSFVSSDWAFPPAR